MMTIQKMADMISKYPSPFFSVISLAQSILETGYFTSELFKKANNAFGIKASKPWTGPVINIDTGEYIEGGYVTVPDGFRKYDTVEESVKDHAEFLESTPYRANTVYPSVISASTVEEQADALTGTYATDPDYGRKLKDIIKQNELWNYFDGSMDHVMNSKREGGNNNVKHFIGIDIGHGNNSGPRGNNGVGDEHKFNSIVAVKLKKLLEGQGHKVTFGVQQPHSPEYDLTARTNRFNQLGVDIVISVHANAFHKPSVNGICGFYWHDHSDSKRLCDLIMKEMKEEGLEIYTAGTGNGSIASLVGSWTNFHMVRETRMTAVLMEYGFMTGNRDRQKIFGSDQDKYSSQVALATANGIQNFFKLAEIGDSGLEEDYFNPQGLPTFKWNVYKEPAYPFTPLEVGEEVTIDDYLGGWYNPNKPIEGMKPSSNFTGDKDVITQVMDVNVSHSKRAYLLKDKVSWILEEDLIEARKGWTQEGPVIDENGHGNTQDGNYVIWEGRRYKVNAEPEK